MEWYEANKDVPTPVAEAKLVYKKLVYDAEDAALVRGFMQLREYHAEDAGLVSELMQRLVAMQSSVGQGMRNKCF